MYNNRSLGNVSVRMVFCVRLAMLAGSAPAAEKIEILHDRWGVPHIFADSDGGAMYGLGYATALDRGFQMHYTLRTIQGRLAEVIGKVAHSHRRESSVESDKKMRAFGFYHAAQKVAQNLDAETNELLEAYCAGVNAAFAANRDQRHYLFAKLGFEPEPWTPADAIVSWWRMGQFFGTDGTRDLVAARSPRGRIAPGASVDDAAAVVQRSDVSEEWIGRLARFAEEHGLARPEVDPPRDGPRFSHAWVVGKERTTTGSAVLVSDPQTLVGNPPIFYEYHISGRTFNARGIGVAGSPMLLVGFSANVAWGLTALGADQADLFHLQTDPARPDQYFYAGAWRPMEVISETLKVKGGPDESLRLRRTHWGPVVTEYVFARPEDGHFAVKRVPICQTDGETIQAALPMLRANNVRDLAAALGRWQFPSANAVFGDRQGNVGYRVVGALPVRSRHAPRAGMFPHDGSAAKFDWQGMIPPELLPQLINPRRGYLYSANHRPIASFYNLYTGARTGSLGETLRSWRLGERLAEGPARFAPADVLAIQLDRVNAARRDIVRLGYHLREVEPTRLSRDALSALAHLEAWRDAGFPADLRVRGAALAGRIDTFFRQMAVPIAQTYGGGESGLALFLKRTWSRLGPDPRAKLPAAEADYIDQTLAAAWQSAVAQWGAEPDQWQGQARQEVAQRRLEFFRSLDGFGSLDPRHDLWTPALVVVDGATIHSQGAQAYTQYVPLNDADQAHSLLPPGNVDRPDHPRRLATLSLWESGQLHPAPLSRTAVEAYVVTRRTLEFASAPR